VLAVNVKLARKYEKLRGRTSGTLRPVTRQVDVGTEILFRRRSGSLEDKNRMFVFEVDKFKLNLRLQETENAVILTDERNFGEIAGELQQQINYDCCFPV
jgi:hypothetical protein